MRLASALRGGWLAVLSSVAILGLATLAVLHTPPVRARMLAWDASRLRPAGLVLHADQLDYNLARIDVRLHHLTLATSRTPAEPFFSADEVHVTFGWSVLAGRIDVTVFEAAHPRIVLVRTADSVRNWPGSGTGTQSSGQAGEGRRGSPYAITLGRVRIPDLDIVCRDASTGLRADVSGLSIELDPSGAGASGPLHLARPARVGWKTQETAVRALDARLFWNG